MGCCGVFCCVLVVTLVVWVCYTLHMLLVCCYLWLGYVGLLSLILLGVCLFVWVRFTFAVLI